MLFLYNLLVILASLVLKFLAFFSPKLKLFVEGRAHVFEELESKISSHDKVIWFHAASLGEYEQGLPVMEAMKEAYPNHKLVLTFFSPSGYEVRKNNTIAHVTVYLPLDTKSNAQKFIQSIHPEKVFFIKYEFWPNYLNELKKQNISTFLLSGIFRKNQVFFKWYGGFYRKALTAFDYFFVQNESSKHLIQNLGLLNVTVAGDTRFDRVVAILQRDNTLDFINHFKNDKTTIVIGSSWAKDESLWVQYINNSTNDVKFIIAPHAIKSEQILSLKEQLSKSCILFSERERKDLSTYQVFIVDTIGILTKIYSYADIAYVGGGFGSPGVHNILEPATFGVPIIIGPNYNHFAEATALVNLGGCISIATQNELDQAVTLLLHNVDERHEKGHICETFVQMNKGATATIVNYVKNDRI